MLKLSLLRCGDRAMNAPPAGRSADRPADGIRLFNPSISVHRTVGEASQTRTSVRGIAAE